MQTITLLSLTVRRVCILCLEVGVVNRITEQLFFNGTELQSVQYAVHQGHRVSTINKDSLVPDGIATFWRGYNMFMGDFGHTKTAVKCKLFKQYSCSYYGTPL